jgi:multidrug resistance efflux pump
MDKKKIGFVNQKTSHENLDVKVSILSSRSWLIWFVIVLIFVAFFVWSIFGFVRVREHGLGIIVPRPARIFEADSQENGIVEKSLVPIGEKVEKGQILAKIMFVNLENEIQETEIYIKALNKQKLMVLNQVDKQRKGLGAFTDKYHKAYDVRFKNAKTYKVFMDSFTVREKKLNKEGAISLEVYQKVRNNLFQLENEMAKMMSDMAQFHFQIDKYNFQWEQDIFEIDLKLLEAENKLTHYKLNKKMKQYIKAPLTGTITQVFKNPGAYIREGEVFATVVMDSDEIDVLAFFPVIGGKRIKKGMVAYVAPTVAKKELYCNIF